MKREEKPCINELFKPLLINLCKRAICVKILSIMEKYVKACNGKFLLNKKLKSRKREKTVAKFRIYQRTCNTFAKRQVFRTK